jgi:hypothetical protein
LPSCSAFAVFEHVVCWRAQLRDTAADSVVNVSPLTSKGRVESPVEVIGVAATPPRAPVKFYAGDKSCQLEVRDMAQRE